MAQGGTCHGFAVALVFFPLALLGWGSAGAGVVLACVDQVEGET